MKYVNVDPENYSEFETRINLIDKELKKRGWRKNYILEELNSVKSNFKLKKYQLFEGKKLEKGVDRYIDYLLIDEDNRPLAIIEAKKYLKDPEEGDAQARTYQADIERDIGFKIPIFLTNGETWIFIDHYGRKRKVSGVFSQKDLDNREYIFKNRVKDIGSISINPKIVGPIRPKNVIIVSKLIKHIEDGYDKALVNMATGTGKTRVAMAIIDILLRANVIRNVLFIADRVALADNGNSKGFKAFIPNEPAVELHRSGFTTEKRLYTTTVQTLMGKNGNGMINKFSPGFFDLIIFDEAHRSQYDKNNFIHQYFDAIKIGLTATPKDQEKKNTFELFGCQNDEPTVEYTYDDAVNDRVLVPYDATIIETENLKLGIKGHKLSAALKIQLKKQGVNPDQFDVTGSEFDRIFMNKKTNEVIINTFMKESYKSAEGLPCKSIFFCRSQRHAKLLERMFHILFPKVAPFVEVVTSKYRGIDSVKRFEQKDSPRIALSVGILDTGVDIPEVMNLVFIGPVYSKTRFWQMVGRGTRNYDACKYLKLLPTKADGVYYKEDFKILEFKIGDDSSVEMHKLNKGKKEKPKKSNLESIFDLRVDLLTQDLDESQKKIIVEKVFQSIDMLGDKSFIVREKHSLIKKLKKTFNLENYIKELKDEISPMMIMAHGEDAKAVGFMMQVEKLFLFILKNNLEQIDKLRYKYVLPRLDNILSKENKIKEIKLKKNKIIEVMQDEFWNNLTFERVEFMIKELSSLMKYYEEESGQLIEIDKDDKIAKQYSIKYEKKTDDKLIEFLNKHKIAKRIKENKKVSFAELQQLAQDLVDLNSAYTISYIQDNMKKDFIAFIYEKLGLNADEIEIRKHIEDEFDKKIIDHKYNIEQKEFLLLLKKVFAQRKFIDKKDFGEEPLASSYPLHKFSKTEIETLCEDCSKLNIN